MVTTQSLRGVGLAQAPTGHLFPGLSPAFAGNAQPAND